MQGEVAAVSVEIDLLDGFAVRVDGRRVHDAAWARRDAAAVKLLLQRYPEFQSRINEPVCPFDSPALVHFAQDPAMVDVLLEFGADPNRRSDWWAGGSATS